MVLLFVLLNIYFCCLYFLIDVSGIIYIGPETVYIIPDTYVKQLISTLTPISPGTIQKPLPAFKILYCSWQVYYADKNLERTKKTDLIVF